MRPSILRGHIGLRTILAVIPFLSVVAFTANAVTIFIPSTVPWTDTGINVPAGSQVNITATGTVVYGPLSAQVTGPNGGNYDGTQFFSTSVFPDTIVVSLIGKTGGTTVVGTGTPLPEGVTGKGAGFVGTSYSQIVSTGGELFLGFNDLVPSFADNSGSFSVNISVVPEPSGCAIVCLAMAIYFGLKISKASGFQRV